MKFRDIHCLPIELFDISLLHDIMATSFCGMLYLVVFVLTVLLCICEKQLKMIVRL